MQDVLTAPNIHVASLTNQGVAVGDTNKKEVVGDVVLEGVPVITEEEVLVTTLVLKDVGETFGDGFVQGQNR